MVTEFTILAKNSTC